MKTVQRVVYLSATTYLLQLIDPLCGLDSDLEETQDASHNVDNSVSNLSRGSNVTDMSAGIVEHEGFDKLGSNPLGELWGGVKAIFPWEAIELLEDQI